MFKRQNSQKLPVEMNIWSLLCVLVGSAVLFVEWNDHITDGMQEPKLTQRSPLCLGEHEKLELFATQISTCRLCRIIKY